MTDRRPTINLDSDADLKQRVNSLLKSVAECTRSASALPGKADALHAHELYMTNPRFNQLIKTENERLITLIGKVFKASGCQLPNVFSNASLDDEERLHLLVQANDALLERIGISLDDAEGHTPETSHLGAVQGTRIRAPDWIAKKVGISAAEANSSIPSSLIVRPQSKFSIPPPDNSPTPFKPKLPVKHNAKSSDSLGNLKVIDDDGDAGSQAMADSVSSSHPYDVELQSLQYFPIQLQRVAEPQIPWDIKSKPVEYVNELAQLESLVQILKKQREFAVDLEHHEYRTYLGLTSLVQISTRDQDFIVDPFPLWSHMHLLNDPFTDPKIVKVLHGANSDILWLQRDFGIYVVNMFDTGLATRQLQYPKYSLLYLVQRHCGVTMDKHYARKDWRVRPLPDDMQQYARSDTHYLLYCYDKLRNELLDRSDGNTDKLITVLNGSKALCAQQYIKPIGDFDRHAGIIAGKSGHKFDGRQTQALRALCAWRDQVAREVDESIHYVLPQHMMLQMALTLPRETQGIHAVCVPLPTYVKRDLAKIHKILVDARDKILPSGEHADYLADDRQNRLISFVRHSLPWLYDGHDYTHTKHDEELPPMVTYDNNSGSNSRRSKSFPPSKPGSIDIFNLKPPTSKPKVAAVLCDQKEDAKAKASDTVLGSVTDWITPYQQHQLAVLALARAGKTVDPKALAKDAPGAVKTSFSHRDASTGRCGPKTSRTMNPDGVNFDSIATPTASEKGADLGKRPFTFDDKELMTKNELKKLKKATPSVGPDMEIAKFVDKRKPGKGGWSGAGGSGGNMEQIGNNTPFDYEKARHNLQHGGSSKTQSTSDVYDPHGNLTKNFGASKRGGGGRGRGGRGARGGGNFRGGRVEKKSFRGQGKSSVFGR